MKIIDFHGHCGIQHNSNYTVPEIINYLNQSIVIKMVISSLSSIFSSQYASDDLKKLNNSPLFVLTYWVNPYFKEWTSDFTLLSKQCVIKGIKLHPTANIYDPTLSFLKPVLDYCRSRRLFITLHTDSFRSSPNNYTEMFVEYPDIDFILLHMDDPINSIFLASKFPNVFLETSWIERKWRNIAPIKIALDCVNNNKIFFGSDFPFEFPLPLHVNEIGTRRDYNDIVSDYLELLPVTIAKNILFYNAKQFLFKYNITIPDL